jgi:hypothetical protein
MPCYAAEGEPLPSSGNHQRRVGPLDRLGLAARPLNPIVPPTEGGFRLGPHHLDNV